MSGVISLTESAAERVKTLLDKRGTPDAYIRVGVKTAGCSGLGYKLEYADEPGMGDEVVEVHGVKVIVDAKSVLYLLGTVMDFQEEKMRSGFVFTNPNQKGECGCGESFTV